MFYRSGTPGAGRGIRSIFWETSMWLLTESISLTMALFGIYGTAQAAPEASADITPRVFVHIRPEVRTNPTFQSGLDDTMYSTSQSVRAGLKAKRGVFSAVVDLQGTQSWGARSSSTGAEPTVYPYQGYLQVGSGKNWLRFGRQEVQLQNGWHISAAPWNVVGRTFDGVRGHAEAGDWTIDGFALTLAAPFARTELTPASEDGLIPPTYTGPSLGETHAGLFSTWKASKSVELSPMAMARFGGPSLEDPDRSLWWVSPGARVFLTPKQSMVDLVVMGQLGDRSDVPIRAYSAMLRARQGLGDSPLKPGVGVILEQNSGSACSTELECNPEVIQDFQTGFGRNHFLRGNADQFRGTNLRDLGLSVDSTPWAGGPKRKLKLTVEGHLFQMVNPEGVWLSAVGTVQGQGWEVGNTDPNLAWEVDALADLRLGKVAHLDGGFCFVQPIGVGGRLTGGAPMTYAFARNRFRF